MESQNGVRVRPKFGPAKAEANDRNTKQDKGFFFKLFF